MVRCVCVSTLKKIFMFVLGKEETGMYMSFEEITGLLRMR